MPGLKGDGVVGWGWGMGSGFGVWGEGDLTFTLTLKSQDQLQEIVNVIILIDCKHPGHPAIQNV